MCAHHSHYMCMCACLHQCHIDLIVLFHGREHTRVMIKYSGIKGCSALLKADRLPLIDRYLPKSAVKIISINLSSGACPKLSTTYFNRY